MAHQTRNAFSKQPAHYVFVDIGPPTKRSTLNLVGEALSNVIALACSIRGSVRIPAMGLSVLCSNPVCLLPLQTLKGKYPLVSTAIDGLLQLYDKVSGSGDCILSVNEITLREGLQEALSQFNCHKSELETGANTIMWMDLQITIISEQMDIQHLINQIKCVLQHFDLKNVKKVQVVKIERMQQESLLFLGIRTNKSPTVIDQSQTESDITDPSGTQPSSELVELLTISQDSFAIEKFFKVWLHDCTTETAHIELRLPPASASTRPPVSILCDVHEPFLNPGAFIFSNHYFISVDPIISHGLLTNQVGQGRSGAELPVPVLDAMHLVKMTGLCESTVYGVPLVLQPTCCWKMEWSDLETNSLRFLSLCRMLEEGGSVLIAKTQPASHATSARDDKLYSYFGVFAARSSLLIKSLVFRDVLLPPFDGQILAEETVPQEIRVDMEARIGSLTTFESYNPVHYASSLCTNLKRCLSNAQASRPPMQACRRRLTVKNSDSGTV